MITRAKKKNLGFIGADNKIFTMADIKEESPISYETSTVVSNTPSTTNNIGTRLKRNSTTASVEPTVQMPNSEGYTPTNKKYGDYKYQDYLKKKDYDVYKKDGKAYYFNGENYIDMDTPSIVSPEQDKRDYKEAIKYGYVDRRDKNTPTKIADLVNLDTNDLTEEEKEKYTKSLIRQEKKRDKELAYVRRGGAGVLGTIGELQNIGKGVGENVIEPIARAPESYNYGKLSQDLSEQYYNKMMGKKNNVDELNRQLALYNQFNNDIAQSNNQLDSYFKNLPNQVSGIKAGIKGAGILGAAGAAGGGFLGILTTKDPATTLAFAENGAKLLGGSGYVAGQAQNTYKLEAGAEYQALLEMGVPENIAKKEAKRVGTENALIESGDSILDLITLGKASAATEALKEGLIKKYGLDLVKSWGIAYGANILSEGGQEGFQEQRSIEGEKRAAKKAGIKRDDSQDLQRIKESAIGGAVSAAISGVATKGAGIAGSSTQKTISNKVTDKIQNKQNISTEDNTSTKVAKQEKSTSKTAQKEASTGIIEETRPIAQETQKEAQNVPKKATEKRIYNGKDYSAERYQNLSDEDIKTLDSLYEKKQAKQEYTPQEQQQFEYLQRKTQGLKNPELKTDNKFNDLKSDYGRYYKNTNLENFDSKMLDNAEATIQANKQGRRTKQEWIDIAENIGMQAENMDSEALKKYAFESFKAAAPNQSQNLNRQGQKYVNFGIDEWVNAVYKGAKVGQKVQQPVQENIAEQRKENVLEIPKEKAVQTGKEGEQFFEKQGAPKEVAKILSEKPRAEKPKLKEKIKTDIEKQKEYIKSFRRKFTDKGQELYDIGKKTKNDELYASYDFAGMSEGNGQYQIGKGQTNNEGFLYKNFTDKDGNKVPMSLEGMWKDIDDRGYGEVMDEYLAHTMNADIYGRPTASSQKDINAIMDQVASGFMTPEDAEKAIDASTKIQSVFGEGVTKEDSLKRIKEIEKEYPGIKKAAENVWQFGYNMLDNMVDAGLVSQREAKRMKEETPHYARLQRNVEEQSQSDVATDESSVKVKSPIQERKGGTQDIIPFRDSMADYVRSVAERKRMNKIGIELAKSMKTVIDSNIDDKVIDETGFTFGDALKENENGTYTLKYFDKGKPKQLVINKGIYEALQPREKFEFEDWAPFKLTGKASKIQRDAITGKNLLFSANNVPKDLFNAIFSTKNSLARFGKNYFKAIPQLLTNGEYAQRYQALGGNQNTYYNYEEGYIKDKSKIKALKAGQTIINGIERVNNFFEQVPRVAEFMSSLESGKSVEQAMYDAAEVTTNFKRGGDVAKAVDRIGANYFNPSIQGASKFVRNFTEAVENKQYAKILTRTALLGIAPAILGELMWGDDDEYKELPDYQKDNYFLFKKGNGDWIRIPKGQIQGALQSLPRRAFTASRGQKNAFAGVGDTLKNNVAPNNPIDDSVIGPFIAVARNKAWSGNPIVSDYLKNEDYPEDEYTSKTDEFSKWLGKKLHKSPAKINYLLDQYTGGIGDFVLPNLTKRTTKENTGGINAITNPLKDKFITNTTYSNKAQSDFYDALTHAENAKKHYGSNSEQALEYKYLNSVSQKISEKRKELEEIQSSNAPRKEKYEKAKELQDEMNKMARDAVKVKPKKEDGAISFGGTLYYKDGNEYKKASDKDEQKREFSGMSISDYYRSKIEQQKENKAAKEEKEKTKQSALSAFDLKEKDYDKYQYNISQFKADKDSEGKTIRGSKKDKVIDYVEGLPISDVQKAILIKGEGLSYKKYDDAIEDWLNSSKLNDDEKQKVKDYYKIK